MDLQTRKLNLISYLAQIQDESLLTKIENHILKRKMKDKESDFKPFTIDELINRIEKSEKDLEEGKSKTQAELKSYLRIGKLRFVKIIWSDFTIESLKDIFDYHKAKASKKVVHKIRLQILESTKQLVHNSEMGSIEFYLERLELEHRCLLSGNYKIIQ